MRMKSLINTIIIIIIIVVVVDNFDTTYLGRFPRSKAIPSIMVAGMKCRSSRYTR